MRTKRTNNPNGLLSFEGMVQLLEAYHKHATLEMLRAETDEKLSGDFEKEFPHVLQNLHTDYLAFKGGKFLRDKLIKRIEDEQDSRRGVEGG